VRCIFVLDVFNGAVVHAVRGERSRYEPIDKYSKIVSTSVPLEILKVISPRDVYVADLNLITKSGDNLSVIAEISRIYETMADIGISHAKDLSLLPNSAVPVLGTETSSLKLIENSANHKDIIVSIDMKRRKVLTNDPNIVCSPLELIQKLNSLPIKSVILLDLDKVGTSSGLDRNFLEKAALISDHPLILGGGVKGMDDLDTLDDLNFFGALVATAIHNGNIPLELLH
jgi:phosphoribosylformimino-5-aminoimidazole carboxamide ribotide isomerase